MQTLDTGRRSAYDPDELDEEQREREQRNKARVSWRFKHGRLCTAAVAHALSCEVMTCELRDVVRRSTRCTSPSSSG